MKRKVLYKQCPICGERKPLEDFWRNRAKTDGRAYLCKVCGKARRGETRHRPYTDEFHVKCGGKLVRYKGHERGHTWVDPELARCEKCRMVGVPA